MATDGFRARTTPIRGAVAVPGSKSISNRALVCAALAAGDSHLFGLAEGDDTARMIAGIRQLGATVDVAPAQGERGSSNGATMRIRGPIVRDARPDVVIDAGLAGTTSRFLTALAALSAGRTTITGGAGLRARPMGELHRTLRALGVDVVVEREGFLPVTVQSRADAGSPRAVQKPREVVVGGEVSSQFISALMMIAPALGGLELRIDGPVVSRGYLDMTAAVMRRFAAEVQVGIDRVSVTAAPYRATDFEIDADWSSASYPFAAAAIVGGEVSVPRLRRNDTQPEEAFVGVLEQLGCRVRIDAAGVTVTREMGTALRGVDVDMSVMSDLVPTLAAIAACANGATTIRGVGFIRSKESDRLGDLAAEINRCGGRVRVLADGLSIEPAAVTAATIDAHDDHRLAMSLALLGLRHDGVVVAEPGVVAKSWPSYWSAMRRGLSLG